MQLVSATERAATANRASTDTLASALLRCGVIAGPLYIIVGAIQVLIRPGFDVRYNVLSQMALGDLGWIQTANFAACGLLVIGGAIGIGRSLNAGRGATWAPRLIGIYGAGLVGAAIFSADPGFGFPPGTPAGAPTTMSTHGLMHFAVAGIGFFAIIGACFVLGRRFAKAGEHRWARYSAFTGAFFLVAFLGTASGSGLVAFTLGLWVAIGLAWVWLSAVSARLIRGS
ncbi:MAG: DUF998 domain-containing protein [Chloroflexota bacterium]|nr:DUF998 domain-containing protein [Chloroflexota bacterium]